MNFSANYREDVPVRIAFGSLAILALAVALTFIAQILGIGSHASFVDRVFRFFGLVPQTIGTVIVWIMALVALMVLGLAVLLLRQAGPIVVLDANGLHDRRWSAQAVGWLNIAEFDPVRRFGMDLVQVRLKDAGLDPPPTLLARAMRRAGLVPPDILLISLAGLDCKGEALCAHILEIGTATIHAAEDAAEEAAERANAEAGGAAMPNN